MAIKKKKESLADQIINGTYEPKFSVKNIIPKKTSIVDRVQQRLDNTSNNAGITDRVQLKNNIINEQNLSMADRMKKMASTYGKTYETSNNKIIKSNNTNSNSNNSTPSMWSKVVKRMGDTVQNYSERTPYLVKADKQKIMQSKKADESNKIDRTLPVLIQSMQRKQNKNKNENEIDLSKIATPTLEQINIRNNDISSNSNLKLTNKKEEKTWGDKLVEAGKDPKLLGNQITTSAKKTGASVPYSLLTQATQGYGDNNALKNSALYTDFKQGSYGEFEQKMKLQNAKMHGFKESNIEKTRQNLKKYINEQNMQIQENINNASNEISKKLLELTPSMVQSGIGAGITAGATALGGAGIGQAIGTAFFSETAFADYYDDAIERGLTGAKANKYATAMAFWEGASEEFITSERLIPSQTMKAFLGGVGKDVVENFAQEALTDPLQEILAKASGGDYDIENLKENMIRDGFDGALTSLIMFGATNGIPSSINIAQKLNNGENISPNELKTAWKDLEKVEGKEVLEAQMENGIQSTINEMLQRANQKLDGVSRNNIIENSNLSDESKASLLRVAEKHNMSTEEVQNLINNPPNEQVSQNNQQVVQPDNKMAENGNTEQTTTTLQNYLKNASDNGLDVQNKTVKSIFEVTQKRGIGTEYNEDFFKNKNGEIDTNKNAVWTIDDNGNRKIIINPKADTKMTLQNIMVHELTHDFEGSKEYDTLSKLVLDKMEKQEGYAKAREDLEEIYSKVYDKNSKDFQTLIDQEAVAGFLGENLGNQEFVNELVQSQPRTVVQKIYDWIVDKIAKVTGNEQLYWKNVEQKFKNAYNSQNENSSQDSKYSIGGIKGVKNIKDRNIKSSALKNYQKAQKMAKANINNKKIFEETGWYKDKVTGKFKFNFSDKDMELKSNNYSEGQKYKLKDIIKHDTLFEIYPQLKDYDVKIKDLKKETGKNLNGRYNSLTNELEVDINRFNDKANVEGTLIHEIQHAIQKIEKFANGTSTKFGKDNYKVSPGEKEARDTTRRFLLEKYKNKDLTNKLPKSAKFEANILEKMKIGLYNYITNIYEEVNDNEISKHDQIQNKEIEKTTETKNNRPVLGGIENSNNSFFSMEDNKYSYQSNGAWNDFLKKHSINKGTGETIQQVKLPQMPIENFQKVLDTAQHIPQEEKEYLLETVKDIKRNKTSLEDFKNTIETMEKAYSEQNENILDTKKTYNTGRRETYQKYMKANTEYDSSSLENAKNIVPANHQGRRTKAQWLTIAKQMGTEIATKPNAEIEEIAYRTWQDERPSNKESLNRQGEKFVMFTSDEWINTIYDAVKEQREKYSISTDNNNELEEVTAQKAETNNGSNKLDIKQENQVVTEERKPKTRKEVRQMLLDEMNIAPEDLEVGKDISSPNYQITDPIRVNEKVFGRELGKKINDATINQTKHNTAEKIRWLNKERQEIADLGIKARSKESSAVQKYGEKQWVDTEGKIHKYGDAELTKEFPNIQIQEKIKNASNVIRQKYDTYIDQINEVLTAMGYDEIPKRQDYMRHFQELGDIFSQTGIPFNLNDMSADLLPTDINGLTEFNRPGKNWFASAQKRYGNKTTYDAITGIDGYLEGAGNLIFHTEDIQRYRALSRMIRDTFGTTKGFDNLDGLTPKQQQQRIDDIMNNKLSGYVAWLDEQANALAGKKGTIDRGAEAWLGRRIYSAMNTLKKQVGSNMTGFNIRSALTNFISVTQAGSKTQKKSMIEGLVSTIKNMFNNDGFIGRSDFLTSRFGSDTLSKKIWDKASNAGQIFMTGTDYFTANLIARSKYYEGLNKGMTEQEALDYSNDFSSRVMGDRSQGATANAFNSKILGLLTQFQLETNNQWQYIIHDTKMDFGKNASETNGLRAGATALFQMGQLAVYSYFFNELFEKLTGSRSAFDPIDILKKLFGLDDDDEDKDFETRMKEAGAELADAIPFTSLFGSGGRLPISEALKPFGTAYDYVTGGTNKYGQDVQLKDVAKDLKESVGYIALPTGYGQLKKTVEGLNMYNKKLPVAGSYTDSGNLRYTVDDDTKSKVQAGLFGKWANEYAKDYRESGYKTISANNIQEMKDLNMNSTEYRKYKTGLSQYKTNKDRIEYINSLNATDKQKNIMANNVIKSDKYQVDMSKYNEFSSYEEFEFSYKYPEKYKWLKNNKISYKDYTNNKEKYNKEYSKSKK